MLWDQLTNPWLLVLIPLISSGVGAYVGAYLKKKGENLATHEDFEKILDELRATTTTTKEIEAKISGELWDKQKQWEIRRDALFEISKALGGAKDTLVHMHSVFMTEKESVAKGRPERPEKKGAAYEAYNKAADGLDQAFMLGTVTCGPEIRDTVGAASLYMRNLAVEIADGKPERFLEVADEFTTKISNVAKAIRAELGLPPFQRKGQ